MYTRLGERYTMVGRWVSPPPCSHSGEVLGLMLIMPGWWEEGEGVRVNVDNARPWALGPASLPFPVSLVADSLYVTRLSTLVKKEAHHRAIP